MHELDDELPPVIGERYVDILAERAIATLDDYAPEPPARRSAGRAFPEDQCPPESAGGDCAQI